MQIEMGNFDVPKLKRANNGCINALNDFLKSEQTCLKCEFEDRVMAARCASMFSIYRKRKKLNIEIVRRDNVVYVRRRDNDADKKD